ncbi:hypothetical protein LTR95_012432, partial [Oleoguttula sp. CCFEE 5521]
IAEAITSQYGVKLHMKTISRKRCEWGLRTRAKRGPNPNPSIRKRPVSKQKRERYAKQAELKAEITARTERGESAQQITDEVVAMGFELKSGVATVLRLQTFWSLVPAEQARAAEGQSGDSVEYRKLRASESKARSKRWAKERAAAAEVAKAAEGRVNGRRATVVHYPTNCTFGPGGRLSARGGAGNPMNLTGVRVDDDDHDDGGVYVSPYGPSDVLNTALGATTTGISGSVVVTAPAQEALPPFSYTRDIMSANLMVDLAISMLSAAKDIKDLMIAGEIRRPATNSITGLPPSHEEVISAKRKPKEATRCAWDLAKDGVLGDV